MRHYRFGRGPGMRIARITTQPVIVLFAGTRSATASSQLLDAKYFALHA